LDHWLSVTFAQLIVSPSGQASVAPPANASMVRYAETNNPSRQMAKAALGSQTGTIRSRELPGRAADFVD
jgi:hypothetical protein